MVDPAQGCPPRPDRDEIIVMAPAEGDLCNTLAHRRAGVAAQVVVTFGNWAPDTSMRCSPTAGTAPIPCVNRAGRPPARSPSQPPWPGHP